MSGQRKRADGTRARQNPISHRQHIVASPSSTDETRVAMRELKKTTQDLLSVLDDEVWSRHSLVTMNVRVLSRLLYLNNLYQKILDTPGVICEFGVHWGATLAQLINLRSIYEPFNHSRMIYGFDTFAGFPSVHELDGKEVRSGDLYTMEGYEATLEQTLEHLEKFPPLSHIKKFALIKGDASQTIDRWLEENPHAIISLAIFDMDIYEPTKAVLEKIKPRLTKGSVLAFDELNYRYFPGETRALDEVIGLNNLRLRRSPHHPFGAWAVFGE
jgi:predicted O-methyltransferase YrrM